MIIISSKMSRRCQWLSTNLLLLLGAHLVASAQINVDVQHDLSQPTFGLQGPTSSKMSYNEQSGLNLKGTISELLGPPIKIANGFSHLIEGSKLAGAGTSLLSGGAVLGIDAKALETLGGASLLKGGLLMGGAAAKTAAATVKGGLPGKKIASIIELPVKLVAMNDLKEGKVLAGAGAIKGAKAVAMKHKGAELVQRGDALKIEGINQVKQGAQEGLQNIGNMVQQASGNAQTALKFLPIILDLPMGQQQQQVVDQQQQQVVEQSAIPTTQQQQYESKTRQSSNSASMTGGSPFGGLGSLMPGMGGQDPLMSAISNGINSMSGAANSPAGGLGRLPFNLFGGGGLHSSSSGQNHDGYAIGLNRDNPFLSMLANPRLNPLLLPLGSGGPLAQALQTSAASIGSGTGTAGIKVHESTSSQLPSGPIFKLGSGGAQKAQQQQVEQTKQVEQQQQQQVEQVLPQAPQQQQQQQQSQIESPK